MQIKSMKIDYQTTENFWNCDWCKFLSNVFTKKDAEKEANQDKMKSIYQTIGYLLSRYKMVDCAVGVIIADAEANFGADAVSSGGTGKNIFLDAINQYRPYGFIDGKKLKTDNRFLYSAYQTGQNTYIFNDIRRDFNLEYFYNEITNDLEVEKKGDDIYILPFSDSPKFVFTSNFIPKGLFSNNSTARRFVVQEIEPHYNADFKPSDEFGRRFFDDWEQEDWNCFNAFNIYCIQEFLKAGKIQNTKSESLKIKSMLIDIPDYVREFLYSWKDENDDKLNGFVSIYPAEVFEDYHKWCNNHNIPYNHRTAHKQTFNKYMKLFFSGGLEDISTPRKACYTIKKFSCTLIKDDYTF